MTDPAQYTKYTFQGYSGYIVTPRNTAHEWVAVRHSACVAPWVDVDVHIHEHSEEYYLLLQGELLFLVAESLVTLRPQEMLVVEPQIPHAIVKGEGLIEHFGIRIPAANDRRSVGEIPLELSPAREENERELRRDWGYRIPLEDAQNQNCPLIGVGTARFYSPYMFLAYLNFPTVQAAHAAAARPRHRLHLHQESWEYYTALKGTKILQVEDELVEIKAGEILQVHPRARHVLYGLQGPYQGFTFRVPTLPDKVEF